MFLFWVQITCQVSKTGEALSPRQGVSNDGAQFESLEIELVVVSSNAGVGQWDPLKNPKK